MTENKENYLDLPSKIISFSLLYYLSAKLGIFLALPDIPVSPVWFPSGVAVAVLLLWGMRVWPGILIAELVLNLTSTIPFLGAVGMAAGNIIASLMAVFLLHTVVGFSNTMDRPKDIVGLILFAAVLSQAIGALLGPLTLHFAGLMESKDVMLTWLTWWAGDAMGVLIITPLFLSWQLPLPSDEKYSAKDKTERLFMFALLIILGQILFGGAFNQPLLIVPIVLLFAFRFGIRETTASMLLISVLVVWHTANNTGSFVNGTSAENFLQLTIFLSIVSITGILLATIVHNARRLEVKLECIKNDHDARLAGTTKELEAALEQVKTVNDLLPLCAGCKKVRNDQEYRQAVEEYLEHHPNSHAASGYCPECYQRMYADAIADIGVNNSIEGKKAI